MLADGTRISPTAPHLTCLSSITFLNRSSAKTKKKKNAPTPTAYKHVMVSQEGVHPVLCQDCQSSPGLTMPTMLPGTSGIPGKREKGQRERSPSQQEHDMRYACGGLQPLGAAQRLSVPAAASYGCIHVAVTATVSLTTLLPHVAKEAVSY